MNQPGHILVVDDELKSQNVIKAFVEFLGYTSEGASDGLQALEKLKSGFDLVLLDVMMPGMNGFEVVQRIRENPEYSDIPIIMVTALDDKETRLRAVEAGANDFINKPIERLELQVRIASLIKIKETQDAIKRHKADLEETVKQRTSELILAKDILELEIKERKLVEQELLLSQQKLELAMQASDLGTWDWTIDSDELCFDRRWSSRLGYSSDEVDTNTDTWLNRMHPDDKTCYLKNLKSHLKNHSPYFEAEYRLRIKSGGWRWILDRGRVVNRDPSGNPLKMAGIYLDIADRKRLDEKLHETTERLRAVFKSARDCIFVKNLEQEYTEVNPYFANILGRSESEILGRKDTELFEKDAAEVLGEIDARVLKGESIEQEQTRKVNGYPRTFLDTKVPMRNSQGEIIGVIGISREITERKRNSQPVPLKMPNSKAMRSALHFALLAAETDSIVLLSGESGSGKDYLARQIHDHSKRSSGPYFEINCASVSHELAESELFGHESGAFTGAKGLKRGLLELAEGGTILLNEIGELSLPLQSKLLTFLDTRQFTRVGGVKRLSVGARLIAATNRNLEKEVKLNRFRQDLFFRLNVFSVDVPPLRDRTEDIPDLVSNLLAELAHKMGLNFQPQIEPEVIKAFKSYAWPGNIRELRNVLERALILCDRRSIGLDQVKLNSQSLSHNPVSEWSITVGFPKNENINDVAMNLKRLLVVEALDRAKGSRKGAAELLGVGIDSIKHYIKIFDLHRCSD